MNGGHYILQDGEPVPIQVYTADGQLDEAALMQWAIWFQQTDARRVAETRVHRATVSTVFLGLDHSWNGGPPLLFETMAFWPGVGGEEQERYTTLDEARAGHERMVAYVRARWWKTWLPLPGWLLKFLELFDRQE